MEMMRKDPVQIVAEVAYGRVGVVSPITYPEAGLIEQNDENSVIGDNSSCECVNSGIRDHHAHTVPTHVLWTSHS